MRRRLFHERISIPDSVISRSCLALGPAGFFCSQEEMKMNYPVIDIAGTGRNIRDAIRRSGRSVSDIAEYLGSNNSLVYRYMRGEVLPSTDRLLALSVLFGVSMNDLLAVA